MRHRAVGSKGKVGPQAFGCGTVGPNLHPVTNCTCARDLFITLLTELKTLGLVHLGR